VVENIFATLTTRWEEKQIAVRYRAQALYPASCPWHLSYKYNPNGFLPAGADYGRYGNDQTLSFVVANRVCSERKEPN
jgi:hypothetical protein